MISSNGIQLYGLKRVLATLKMGMHRELKPLSLKQKLALNDVFKASKLTKLGDRIYSNTFTPYYPSMAYDRFLKGLISVVSGNLLPIITNFAVTAKCPCRCWHCSFAGRPKQGELSLEELKQGISEVQEMGTSVIGLTGGEPLLRDDLEDILASIDERSMSLLFTTGFQLTRERVRDLKKAGLGIPVISLDHYRPEVHDAGRRREGMFEWAVRAIEMFKAEGLYTAVSFVPDRKLMDHREELFKTLDLFRDLGVNDMRLTSPILSGQLTNRPESLFSKDHVRTVWEVQRFCTRTKGYPGVFAYDFFESKRYYGCGAGFNYVFVDAQGNVCPCDFTMISFGNLRERPMKDIWGETSRLFRLPGCTCYANKVSGHLENKGSEVFPLGPKESRSVVDSCPPYDPLEIPDFYRKMRVK